MKGSELRTALQERKLAAKVFAERHDLAPETVSRWVNDKWPIPQWAKELVERLPPEPGPPPRTGRPYGSKDSRPRKPYKSRGAAPMRRRISACEELGHRQISLLGQTKCLRCGIILKSEDGDDGEIVIECRRSGD